MANRSSADVRARTADEFVAELRRLRTQAGQPSFRELSRIAERRRVAPAGLRVEPLPPSTTSEILAGKRLPRLPRLEFVESYVAACLIAGSPGGVDERAIAAELASWRELWCTLAEPSPTLVDHQAGSSAVHLAGANAGSGPAPHSAVPNGAAANGIVPTGMAAGGMAPTGMAQTGMAQTGMAQTGMAQAAPGGGSSAHGMPNGAVPTNNVAASGVSVDGMRGSATPADGSAGSAVPANGLAGSVVPANGLTGNGLAANGSAQHVLASHGVAANGLIEAAGHSGNGRREGNIGNGPVAGAPDGSLPSAPADQLSPPAPVRQLPSTAPVQQLPPTAPVYQLPSTAPVHQLPSTAPVYQLPSTAPVHQLPPTASAPGDAPPTTGPLRHPAAVWLMVAVAFVAGVGAGGAGVRWWDSERPPAATGPLGPDQDTCSTTDVPAPAGKDVLRLPASASAASWWTNAGGIVDLTTDGKAFDAAIVGRPGQPSDALIVKGGVDIVRGRTYALAFTAWADRSAAVRVRVQNNAPDYTESYTRDLSVAPGGCRHLFHFTGARSSDHSELTFQVGGQPADVRLKVSDVMLVEQAG